MERMLPKMHKDLLGIVSVLCMVLFPHQVVAEESLCHLDFRPQPYSLEEEVGSLVWEYPKVPLQWKVDLNETNVWKEFLHQKPKGTPRSQQPALYLPQVPWNLSKEEKLKHLQVEDTRKFWNYPQCIGDRPLRLQPFVLEAKVLRQLRERAEPSGSKKRRQPGKKKRLPGRKRKETGEQSKQNRLKNEKRSLKETPSKTPVRRKLDAAMENAGSIESVLLLEKEYKALERDPSHKPKFYFIIDRLISNLRHIPRTVYGPPAGEEERIKLMELRREEEAEEAEATQRVAEEVDEGSAPRKRKLEELEEKKRALEEENDRKRRELEEESRRLKAVEEAERRAREQRSRNPRVQVPVASEKEKQETWLERKATELVENYIQAYGPQQKKSKEAAETYSRTCEDSKQAHEDFISALQKTQEKAETLQKCLGRALEAAVAFGREEERAQQCAQAKDKCTRPEVPRVKARPQIPAGLQERIRKEKAQQEGSSTPGKKEESEVPTPAKPGLSLGVRARKQPAEEEPGKEWRERISSDVWKVGRQLKEGENYLECKYPPFTKEWQDGLREELLSLASRGFSKREDGELYPTKKFGWQLRSSREFESINQSLEQDYGVRLVWKSQEVKGKSKSVDDFHCFPIGKGKMEKVSKYGVQYTVLGTLPPNKSMCSICWSEGHWKSGCPFKDMVVELWEPALAVLVPADRLRKYYPCRNIVCERYQHDKDNNFQYYYPAVALVDYGAVNHRISEINSKRYGEEKSRNPEEYPEIEPPEDEREERLPLSTEQAMEYAASKKAAKPSDPEQRMASHSEALLDMQDQARKRRAKLVEKESKKKAIDVDEESTGKKEGSASKKARGGEGQGDETSIWTKENLPPGHWQDRPKSISSGSQEAKDALRQKLEAHKKEQLEEYHKKKLQKTIATHFEKEASKKEEVAAKEGPGEDEAGSDPPSSSESSESSDATDDQECGKDLS